MEGRNQANQESSQEKKKIKLVWDSELINVLQEKLNEDQESYYMTLTNYTCLIETKDYDYHFLKHLQRPIVFSISRELQRYVDSQLEVDIDYINRDIMKYYSIRLLRKPFYKHTAYKIDINAAYPNCLLINKLIDQKLFDKLMGLDKTERLATIGMLAARKRRFYFEKGVVVEYDDNESPYSKYFFYCVKTIAEIIWKCEVTAGTSFIFSWVDGLYTTDHKAAKECKELIERSGYKCTIDKLTDFNYMPLKNKIQITFSEKNENKLFNIPVENNRLAEILKFIHS